MLYSLQTLLCSKNHSCKNGGTCVANPCDKENGFDCICKENFSGKFCQNVTGKVTCMKIRSIFNNSRAIHTTGNRTEKSWCALSIHFLAPWAQFDKLWHFYTCITYSRCIFLQILLCYNRRYITHSTCL
jgi:hypothetical protein